ncbi:hypothetical protein JW948_08505 [bacterium]|nr:hypothetical protein [bacterium]
MKNILNRLILLCMPIFLVPVMAQTPMDQLHGNENYSYSGLHSGNQVRCNFYNDGMVGRRYVNPDDIGGEWPINTGHDYMNQMIMFVGAEVKDENGEIKHIMSEGNGCTTGNSNNADSGDSGPNGEWYSMAPLPGFANDTPDPDLSEDPRVAMSQWEWSWPETWPDKFEDAVDPGWAGSWNGYFGKNVYNADQESYYVMDDYNNREFAFYPDSTDVNRRGLGLRGTVRGFQWSNVLVEDILFLLYDVKNIGTTNHQKMNFGVMSGPIMGNRLVSGGDGSDDGGEYDLEKEIGYHLDQDDIGAGGWRAVGFLGLAFFESPGNPYDGIDNDGDAAWGSGPLITESLFAPRTVQPGQNIVLIDYQTFERKVMPMPADGLNIRFHDRVIPIMPGQELIEAENNLFDDNLNGLIDENNGSTFGEGTSAIKRYLYLGLKYIDYLTGEGADNILIDEKRDDGIDNDGNWDVLSDDVGLDGVPNSGDPGENDGRPTSGRNTDLPGEPHIDKTDIHESDMIGLTAFNIYTPWTLYPLSDDENLWSAIEPGYLNAVGQFGDTDILMGSGYFPLKTDQIERFSLGVIFGTDREDLFRNKEYAQKTYDENYNFSKAPYIPTVTAVPGDNRVTLLWDDIAETSHDPITGMDFEGYRIYRSTDPGFRDMTPITDQFGSVAYRKPIAQFDLKNNIKGSAGIAVRGIHFWLGEDTGLRHMWTDTTVQNGQLYYYAVTSYDRGSDSLGIAPTECAKYISIATDGTVDKGNNVVLVRPEAPVAGFIPAGLDQLKLLVRPAGLGTTGGRIGYTIIDPSALKNGHAYQVTFEDTMLLQLIDGLNRMTRKTVNYTLRDVTSGDILTDRSTLMGSGEEMPVSDGFQLKFYADSILQMDPDRSGWNRDEIHGITFVPYNSTRQPTLLEGGDYRIEFGEPGAGTSTAYVRQTKELPAVPVNFRVFRLFPSDTGEVKVESLFAFRENDGDDGRFTGFVERTSTMDEIIILNPDSIAGYQVSFDRTAYDSMNVNPEPGDVLTIRMKTPFLSNDVFEFTVKTADVDEDLAKSQMDLIKAVPNPYIIANSWEPLNPYSSGRGPRELHFIHLPARCTIKIFNVRGELVATLEHESPSITDGTAIWDMQTNDNMDIAYGLYIYHVDAGDLGQKIGKFAVIK